MFFILKKVAFAWKHLFIFFPHLFISSSSVFSELYKCCLFGLWVFSWLKKKAAHVKLMNSACTPTWKPLYRWSFINCLNICISDCSRETIPAHMDNEQSPSRDKTISYRNYLALASLNCQGSWPFLSMLTQSSSFYGVTDCFCTTAVAHPRLLPIFLEWFSLGLHRRESNHPVLGTLNNAVGGSLPLHPKDMP